MERQKLFFSIENLLDINPLKNFEVLFSFLDTPGLERAHSYTTGRYPVSCSNILRALIYKNLRGIRNLTDLVLDPSNNPSAASKCGFDILKSFPSLERFSSFLRDTPNESLQRVRIDLILKLIQLGIISGRYLCIDSYHIFANVKENNLKTSVKDRFDKHRVLKGDSEAKLGVYIHYPNPSRKEAKFFWGYRNHAVTDGLSELPVWEVTKPANVHETKLFVPMVSEAKKAFSFDIKGVVGDSEYDIFNILDFII